MTRTTSNRPADTRLIDARLHAVNSWRMFADQKNLAATLACWESTEAPDGSPCLSAEVAGPGAAHALSLFASSFYLSLNKPGDQRPQFDVSVPGRTVLVWRCGGVWVELSHPDTAPIAPVYQKAAPVAAPPELVSPASTSVPVGRWPFLRASGRFPFTRRPKTTKETTTA